MPIIAEFIMSAVHIEQLPTDRLPEIALAGRSNVGKSSLINKVLGKRGLARTSNTPGRTQALNYYRIYPDGNTGKPFYLVDMPGFGFARVSASRRAQWGRLIEDYLSHRETLRGIIHLVDMRHPPQPLDLQMAEWLRHYQAHFLIAATKTDKIASTKVPEQLLQIAEGLNIDSAQTVAFSAETGLGKEFVWRWILDSVSVK